MRRTAEPTRAVRRPVTWPTAWLAAWLGLVPMPSSAPAADALGDTRLFFAPADRASGAGDATDGEPESGVLPEVSSGAGPAAPPTTIVARVASSRPDAVGNGDRDRRIGFEALLRVGERTRVVVGGRPCRGTLDRRELDCDRLPEGVRELALAVDGHRLVVTLVDGRRRRLAVGETWAP